MKFAFLLAVFSAVVVHAETEKKLSRTAHMTTDLAKESSFEISGIERGSIFEKLGFQKGDILMSVNGKTITTQNDAMMMGSIFQSARPLTVIFARDGKTQVLRAHQPKN